MRSRWLGTREIEWYINASRVRDIPQYLTHLPPTDLYYAMAPVTNARVIYNEIPTGMFIPVPLRSTAQLTSVTSPYYSQDIPFLGRR